MKLKVLFVCLVLWGLPAFAQTGWTPKRMDGTALDVLLGRNGATDTTAYGWSADPNTGIIRLGPDSMAIVAGGVVRIIIGGTGKVYFPSGIGDSIVVAGAFRLGTADLWYNTASGLIYIGGVVAAGAARLQIENTAALSSVPLIKIHDNASAGTHNQPTFTLHQDYASATGPTLNLIADNSSYGGIKSQIAPLSGGTASVSNLMHSGLSLNDDAAATLMNESIVGILFVSILNGVTISSEAQAIFRINSISANACAVLVQGGDYTFAGSTSNLTGTVGADGQFTVSVYGGNIMIENRIGATATVNWMLLKN